MGYKKINLEGLKELQVKSKNTTNPIKTLKCRTVAVEKYRHENYIRDLDVHIIDEPHVLLGDDTAPNPSEAVLAALGSCIAVGIQANLVNRGINFTKIELKLEGDIDISAVWGTGELTEKTIGFTSIRVKVDLESDLDKKQRDELIEHVLNFSPVTGSLRNPVEVKYVAE
ncbi:OsmC family protein [Aliarcobacter butzleri]|uniref:OsmC family protein n=1 Tax=Aliarcobacter butzleri TaxID=28197 RepID=A0AAW7PSZ7_9BACT|nr:OsmC family protein [Aliarcobacter butzleri]MCG3682380.1 OsmC family protein [Aliarcobacter butzleri]MCG3684820.1 OsmC family protein [Aliarcobacter butzleri]MCT7587345.1 OsmC family protein [Aliarcobacter butzleri]MCT7611002.1 OsmC family protein [Aliarcobacter butzleri]MCT7616007.1 OsmC family protein [Aliarcobacter butzleri]